MQAIVKVSERTGEPPNFVPRSTPEKPDKPDKPEKRPASVRQSARKKQQEAAIAVAGKIPDFVKVVVLCTGSGFSQRCRSHVARWWGTTRV